MTSIAGRWKQSEKTPEYDPFGRPRGTGLLGQALGREIAPDVPGRYRPGDVRHSWADIGQAQALLGYAPRVSFADGLRETVAWGGSPAAGDSLDAARGEPGQRLAV